MKTICLTLISLTTVFVLAGCKHFPEPILPVIKPSESEVKLEKEVALYKEKLNEFAKRLEESEKNKQVAFNANISMASGSALAVYDTMSSKPEKDRYDRASLAGMEVVIEGLPEPTFADYKKALETQRKLISELSKDVTDGKEEIERQKQEIAMRKREIVDLEAQRQALIEEKTVIQQTFTGTKEKLEKQIVSEKNERIAVEIKAKQDAESTKDLLSWLVKATYILGTVLSICAAIFKSKQLGILGGAAILLSLFITHVPPWVFVSTFAIIVALAIVIFIRGWFVQKKTSQAVIGAIQEHKISEPERYKEGLKERLKDWVGQETPESKTVEKELSELNLK